MTARLLELWQNKTLQHIQYAASMRSDVEDERELMDREYFRTWLLSVSAIVSHEAKDALPLLLDNKPFTNLSSSALLFALIDFGERINPFNDKGKVADKGLWTVITALLRHIDLNDPELGLGKRRYGAVAKQKGTLFIVERFLALRAHEIKPHLLNKMMFIDVQSAEDKDVDELVAMYLVHDADLRVISKLASTNLFYTDIKKAPRYQLQAALFYDKWPDARKYSYEEGVEVLVRDRFGCTPLQCLKRLTDNPDYFNNLENSKDWMPTLLRYYLSKKNLTPLQYMEKKSIPEAHMNYMVAML